MRENNTIEKGREADQCEKPEKILHNIMSFLNYFINQRDFLHSLSHNT